MRHLRLAGYILTCILMVTVFVSRAQSDFYDAYNASSKKYAEGKFDEALGINLKLLSIAERSGEPSKIAYAHLQVGNMHYFLHDKKSTIKCYMLAIALIEKEKIDSMKAEIYHNTSVMYNELGVVDSTLKYSKKAVEILREKRSYGELSRALSALADFYIRFKNIREADKLALEAEANARLAKDERILAFALTKRAQVLAQQNKFKEAGEQLALAGPIYRKYNLVEELMYFYKMQSVYFIKLCDPRGLSYVDSLTTLKDSVFKNETAKHSAEYAALYQTEKKERENKLLLQENLLKQAGIDSRNRAIIGLIIGIVLIAALVAWRISVNNLRKKEKELEAAKTLQKEKERISRDLHDNVGGQLSYVLYSLEGLDDQETAKRSGLVKNIDESVRNVIGNLRETIWAINDESISVNDLSDKLKVYTRTMFKNRDTKIVFHEKVENNITFNSLTGLNLYRICQEIINNAFKHAAASELMVSLTASDKLEIRIVDNGIGFDKEKISDEGYGMANMKKRCEEAGVLMEVSSSPGNGTAYRLLV